MYVFAYFRQCQEDYAIKKQKIYKRFYVYTVFKTHFPSLCITFTCVSPE